MSFRELPSISLIPFVSPSVEEQNGQHENVNEPQVSTALSGTEASDFYTSVISSPSLSAKPPICRKKKKKPPPTSVQTVNVKPNSIFFHAQQGHLNEVKECVNDGHNINSQDVFGWTPIMCAACEGHVSVVEFLLKCGADVNIRSKEGFSVIDVAHKQKQEDVVKLLKKGIHEDIVLESVSDNNQRTEEVKFCSVCKIHFETPVTEHERSIAHLFNENKHVSSTFYHIPENNKGFQLMLKSGWNKNHGLGPNADGRKFPIKTILKSDRSCIGKKKEVAKVTHFNAYDTSSIHPSNHNRVSIMREKTLNKYERKKKERLARQKEIYFRQLFNDN